MKEFPSYEKKESGIDSLIQEIAVRQNKEMSLDNFLDREGKISPASQNVFKDDFSLAEKELYDIKSNIIGINTPDPNRIRDYYVKTFNFKGSTEEINRQIIKKWEGENKGRKSILAEKVIFVVLYKLLKDRFIVVRTSDYDDYKNGVDFLIVDKKNGSVVGAIDGLHDENKGSQDRAKQKEKKVQQKNERGGAMVRFGLRVDPVSQQAKPESLKNVPVFYLPVKNQHLEQFKNNQKNDLNKISANEDEVIDYFKGEINKQIESIMKQGSLNHNMTKNLNNFIDSVNLILDDN